MFLHTHVVGRSHGFSVKRHVKGEKNRVTLKSTQSQAEYMKYFNAVDRNDRDSSDYSVSQRTHRWFLRLYFFLLDRVIHGCFVVVVSLTAGYKSWSTFRNTNGGRRNFQIQLGLELINYGISLEWPDPTDASRRPKWVRRNVEPYRIINLNDSSIIVNILKTVLGH